MIVYKVTQSKIEEKMPKGVVEKRGRLIKWSAVILSIALILFIASRIFSRFVVNTVNEKVEEFLPLVSDKFGVTIEFDKIDLGLFTGKISNLRFINEAQKNRKTLLHIPSVAIEYSLVLEPNIHVKLNRVLLKAPKAFLTIYPGKRTNLPEKWMSLPHEKNEPNVGKGKKSNFVSLEKKLKRFVDFSEGIKIYWSAGAASLEEGHFIEEAEPFKIDFIESRGRAFFDLYSGKASVTSSIDLDNNFGKILVNFRTDGKTHELVLKGDSVSVSPFAPYLPSIVIPEYDGRISGTLETKMAQGNMENLFHFDGDVKGLAVNHWRLSKEPIREIGISANGLLVWNRNEKYFSFPMVRVGNQKVSLDVQGRFDYEEKKKIKLIISGRDVSIQGALDSIPKDFIPKVYGARVAGTFDLDFLFALDMANPNKLRLEPNVSINDYSLLESSPGADIKALKDPFKQTAIKNGVFAKEFIVGPSNPSFVPFEELGYWTKRAVLTCEDGRFFRHRGFQLRHIKASLIRNIKEKRFVRGGSTISMQLAKNLFLTGEKNLSRKFQEMLLTIAIEREIDKNRMFEIYMNIIEWGPKLYGIGPAAIHYFGKSPAALTPIEAAFLGSIIANPVRYHYMYSRGSVSGHWGVYLSFIIRKMGAGQKVEDSDEPLWPEFGWVRRKRLAREKEEKEKLEKENLEKEERKEEEPVGKLQ